MGEIQVSGTTDVVGLLIVVLLILLVVYVTLKVLGKR